jgi:sec-independent protein translocase protein TatA
VLLAFWNNLAGFDGLVILIIALLIFGKRLPEVMRSLGKGISEFKKGMNDIADAPVQQQQPYQQYQQPAQQQPQPIAKDASAPPQAPMQPVAPLAPSEPVKDLPPKTL